MRCTQYIGLTKRAQDFVNGLNCVKNSNHHTEGMFGEDVPLGEWLLDEDIVIGDKVKILIKEVVQVAPWSSGPMIFTCLDYDSGSRDKSFKFLEWTMDPHVKNQQFDHSSGTYFV